MLKDRSDIAKVLSSAQWNSLNDRASTAYLRTQTHGSSSVGSQCNNLNNNCAFHANNIENRKCKKILNQKALHNAQDNKAKVYEGDAQVVEKDFEIACCLFIYLYGLICEAAVYLIFK